MNTNGVTGRPEATAAEPASTRKASARSASDPATVITARRQVEYAPTYSTCPRYGQASDTCTVPARNRTQPRSPPSRNAVTRARTARQASRCPSSCTTTPALSARHSTPHSGKNWPCAPGAPSYTIDGQHNPTTNTSPATNRPKKYSTAFSTPQIMTYAT